MGHPIKALYMKAGWLQQASGKGNIRQWDGSFGTTIVLVSTAAITNCHKLSGLKQQSSLNYKSVHSMAQLVPSSRSHRAEITVSAGPHSLQEALGNESSSRLIKVVGRIWFPCGYRTEVPFCYWPRSRSQLLEAAYIFCRLYSVAHGPFPSTTKGHILLMLQSLWPLLQGSIVVSDCACGSKNLSANDWGGSGTESS